MAFTQGIQTVNILAANQPVSSSITPVDVTGFTKSLSAAARLYWEVTGLFSTGATGGFRFLGHCTVAPTTYNAIFTAVDITTPATFNAAQTAEAAFTNASAVATNYLLNAAGNVIAAGATTFSFQFAQNNSQVAAINMLAGLAIKLWQY